VARNTGVETDGSGTHDDSSNVDYYIGADCTQPAEIDCNSGVLQYMFKGLIDDVRIYNRVLSKDEIKRLYNMGR